MYRLVNADIDGKRFNLRYEGMSRLGEIGVEFSIGIETLLSPNEREVKDEFNKRLELLGGTIERPND